MGFGLEIKRLRSDVPISVQKIADLIGVDAERWRKWEEKDLTPRAEDVQKIEFFFKLPLPEIMKLRTIKNFLIVPREAKSNLELLPGSHGVTIQDHLALLKDQNDYLRGLVDKSMDSLKASLTTILKAQEETHAHVLAGLQFEARTQAKGKKSAEVQILNEIGTLVAANLSGGEKESRPASVSR